jgi:hypothetical protein
VDTINYNIFLSLYAAGHGSFSQMMLFLFVLKNATHFGAPITQSASSSDSSIGSSNEPFAQSHAHQKNNGTSFNQFLFVFSLV